MKRMQLFLLAAAMLLSFAGCGSADPEPLQQNFTFTYNGIRITPGAETGPIIAALGEPKSYTEEPSCAFEGKDKTYYYGSFYLSTYSVDGRDHVYRIWFADDSVATGDGLRIGNTQAEAEAVYGTDCFNGTDTYTQSAGTSKLTIILADGVIASIQYEIMLE